MPRALFEKTGNAIYTSHLDLMRVFQRAFKRAGLPLTHTQGFNPRPSVSIALPLSLGVESRCELLDFDLEGEKIDNNEILLRLNNALIDGVRILHVYDDSRKVKHLAYLDCVVTMEYDAGVRADARERMEALFCQEQIVVEKKGKNGITQQDIRPMIRTLEIISDHANEISIHARICCQNPALNPMQLSAAISKYLPDLTPDFVRCCRVELYDHENNIFR
jgi:radical SAM-linked protein